MDVCTVSHRTYKHAHRAFESAHKRYGHGVNARLNEPVDPPIRRGDLAFASHPEAMWILERATARFLDVNAAALKRYGYDRRTFMALSLHALRVPEEHDALDATLAALAPVPWSRVGTERAFPGIGQQDKMVWHRRSDGTRFPVQVHSDDVQWSGIPARLVLARDLSEQHALRKAVHDAYNHVADGIVTIDRERRYTYLNKRAAQLLGALEPQELVGRLLWDAFPDGFDALFRKALEGALGGTPWVLGKHFFAPKQCWFETRLHPTPEGVTIFFTDVTERHTVAEAQIARKQYYRMLAEQLPAIIYRTELDPPYTTLWVSPRISELGYTMAEWLSDPAIWAKSLHPDDHDRVLAETQLGLTRQGEVTVEYRLRTADGDWKDFQDVSLRVDSEDGRPSFIQGVMVDITERRHAEAALEASRVRLVGLTRRLLTQEKETTRRLAQTLHDGLGQTLAVARLHQDAVVAALPPDSAAHQAATRVDSGLADAVKLVRLVLADLRPPLLHEQGLLAALDNEVRSVVRTPGSAAVSLVTRVRGPIQHWSADVQYGAFMIVREALANALRHGQAQSIRIEIGGGARSLHVEVTDNGIGIDPEYLDGRAGHLGIVGMHERALAIGARLRVTAGARSGTRVRLDWSDRRRRKGHLEAQERRKDSS